MAKSGDKKKTITPAQVLEAAQKQALAPVYYFYATQTAGGDKQGRNPFNQVLLTRTLDALMKAVVDGRRNDFNFSTFLAADTRMDSVIAVAETFPMMRPKRLVIVKDAQEFRADDWRQAERYLRNPSPSTCLVLVGDHLPTRNKGGDAAKTLVTENATLVSFAPFARRQECEPYFAQECKQRGLKVARDAEALLYDLLGFDLGELFGALDKLELFAAGREIKVDDIHAVVARTRSEEIWGLLDALAERKLAPALARLVTYLDNAKTDDEILLVGQLIRLYTTLLDVRRLLDTGAPSGEIVQAIGGNEWAAQRKITQAKLHTTPGLARCARALQLLDAAIRSSRVPHEAHFMRFAMRACGELPLR